MIRIVDTNNHEVWVNPDHIECIVFAAGRNPRIDFASGECVWAIDESVARDLLAKMQEPRLRQEMRERERERLAREGKLSDA